LNNPHKNRILDNIQNEEGKAFPTINSTMKEILMKYAGIVGAIALGLAFSACQSTQHKVELKTLQDSVSYGIGMDIGKNLKAQMIDVNPDVIAQALKDVSGDGKMMLTDEQARSAMMTFQSQMMAKHEEKMKEGGEKNKKEGEVFLAENKKKEGIVTLPNGVQYKVLTAGTGRKPKAKDNIMVNYRGSLIDGTEFDNSYKRGEPATFSVSGVIKGLSETIQLMPVGSKWQIFIPSDLGYGAQGAGTQVTSNATLIFEIELLGIK
jgi:FKBP-type peptidyl-prolyl cis-trans isomerase FklB